MEVFVVVERCDRVFMAAFQVREAAERFAARWGGEVLETHLCSSFEEGEAVYFEEEGE